MNILVDMDQVLVDFLTPLCKKYNELYKTNIQVQDITKWDLSDCMDMGKAREIYNSKDYFYNLQPYNNAINVLEKLNQNHNIVIATYPETIDAACDKYRWCQDYLPFISFKNITMTGYKYTMDFDVLIDDNVDYLNYFRKIRICYDQKYNQDCDCDFRVYNWLDVEQKINYISQYYELTNKVK